MSKWFLFQGWIGAKKGSRGTYLLQRNPDPEPAHRLDKDKGEEDTILERIAAPARGDVGRVVHMCRGVRESLDGCGVDGRRRAEEEGVQDERKGYEEAEGRCTRRRIIVSTSAFSSGEALVWGKGA
jgi:hypothetical protein